jgi:hypothetical protein
VLRAEALEEPPTIIASIKDSKGNIIRQLDQPATQGLHRFTWDMRSQGIGLAASVPLGGGGGGGRGGAGGGGRGGAGAAGGAGGGRGGAGGGGGGGGEIDPELLAQFGGGRGGGGGAFVLPGKYTVSLAKRVNGVVTELPGSEIVEVVAETPYTTEERASMVEFQDKLGKLQKAQTATQDAATEAGARLDSIKRAIDATPGLSKLHAQALDLQRQLDAINLALSGDRIWRSHNEGTSASIAEHIQAAAGPLRGTTGHPTKTAMEQYQIGSDELAVLIPKLRKLIETDIRNLEKQLDAAGAPPTPGRLPDWKGGGK